jgi:hypothetical protein
MLTFHPKKFLLLKKYIIIIYKKGIKIANAVFLKAMPWHCSVYAVPQRLPLTQMKRSRKPSEMFCPRS